MRSGARIRTTHTAFRAAAVYAELHCHSTFSLLDGASDPERLVERAVEQGLPALALTDHDDLGGAVRFATAAKDAGLPGIIGAELSIGMADGGRRMADHAASSAIRHPPSAIQPLVLLAESPAGYANLSSLITRARMDHPRGTPCVSLDSIAQHAEGLYALTGGPQGAVPQELQRGNRDGACDALATLLDIFGRRVAVEVWDHAIPAERELSRELIALARAMDVPWVVANDVHYARPTGRLAHDVLCALRHGETLDSMGTRLRPNGEWYLKGYAQIRRRWQEDESGIRQTLVIAERCAFRLQDLTPRLPRFALPPGVGEDEYLARLVEAGADERWGWRRTARHDKQIEHELSLIAKLGLAGYFLVVWDIVRFARRDGILCQGRGSAANSAVCYCLGVTAVDPIKLELLFERFLSAERKEPPDIDIDFAHRDRERVLQYVYDKYGREHAAMVCEHITWRGRSAVRDAARVLGFSPQQGDELALVADRFSAQRTAEAIRGRAEGGGRRADEPTADHPPSALRHPTSPADPFAPEIADAMGPAGHSKRQDAREFADRVGGHMMPGTQAYARMRAEREAHRRTGTAEGGGRRAETATVTKAIAPAEHPPSAIRRPPSAISVLADIVASLHEAPRHRGIHVGGFVITEQPLRTIVPIEPAAMDGRTVIQWDKDDLDPVGLVKIDLLGLGMLTLLQDCIKYVRATRGVTIDLAQIDTGDQAVYDDLCRADTVGVFQVESRAQMNTLPRLKPRCFYDLVVEVALIRPGPIQGEMVHPYLRRRAGEEAVTYPHPSLEPVLKRTLGIPLFQEQGMQVAIVAAGFTPGEADLLRKAMGHKRSHERMAAICEKMIEGMKANGIADDVARRIYQQINAFADYGFPESHAASFALIVYASAYLRHYYAAEYLCAILNAQPMGFYSEGTLVEDAKRHGVKVAPACVVRSGWDHQMMCADGKIVRPKDGVVFTTDGGGRRAEGGNNARAADGETDARTACSVQRKAYSGSSPAAPPVVRLGLRSVRGLGPDARERIGRARAGGAFRSIDDFVQRTRLDRRALRLLAESGALDAFVRDEPVARRRRVALWKVLEAQRGSGGPLALFPEVEVPPSLPAYTAPELTEADYRLTGVSLHGHPMRHLRALLKLNDVATAKALLEQGRDGQSVGMAGLVICRQRPGTAKGFVFLTLEDETGMVNVVVTPQAFERQALLISRTPLLLVRGVLQVEQRVVNIRAREFLPLEGEIEARSHDYR